MADAADGVVAGDVGRADDLARQVGAAHQRAVLTHKLAVAVDARAAGGHHQIGHGVHGVEGTLFEGKQVVRAAKDGVLARGDILVVLGDGLGQLLRADHLAQFLDGVGLEHVALIQQLGDLLLVGEGRGVAHHAGKERAVIRQHVLGQHDIDDVLVGGAPHGPLVHGGGGRLVKDALAGGVDPDGAVVVDVAAKRRLEAADRHGTAVAGAVVHIVKGRAGAAGEVVAAADGGDGVIGGDVGEVVLLEPALTVAIAAGGDDGAGSGNLHIVHLDADHVAVVVKHEVGDQRIQAQLGLARVDEALQLFHQGIDKIGAAAGGRAARGVGHAVGVHGQVSAAVHLIGELHAHVVLQPVDGLAAALGVHLGDLGVHVLLAAAHGDEVVIESLGAVLDAGFLLDLVAGAADGAARGVRGAAHAVVLLQHQHIRAQLGRVHAGHQARHARAHHDHVRLDGDLKGLVLFGGLAAERGVHGRLDGVRSHGRAGHAVHVGALRLDDGRRDLLDRRVADAGRLLIVADLNAGDLSAFHGHGYVHRAAHAVGRAGVGAVGQGRLRHGAHGSERRAQRQRHHKRQHQHAAQQRFPASFHFRFLL